MATPGIMAGAAPKPSRTCRLSGSPGAAPTSPSASAATLAPSAVPIAPARALPTHQIARALAADHADR
ncbi:hypothetical protein [Frankia sp. AgB32]|uniref:hypothetical protein n=1 Tax=Frankia sp. AgB32 TaxID=631119 RepID=UPI0020105716|nr:hypothetical protein [Frankia sp. AgB32]MCK9897917.1 hypothetical protein [Frankia sp. AgB32]